MSKKSMGEIISTLRKENNMTQRELAEKMNVTDKAVSKWERNLSCPDISSLPALAEALGVPVEALLDAAPKAEAAEDPKAAERNKLIDLILRAVPLAMGVGVVAGLALNKLTADAGLGLLGIGMFSLSLYLMRNGKE